MTRKSGGSIQQSRRQPSLGLWLWEMSHVLALFTLGIVALALLITALAGRVGISDTLGESVPTSIRDFFNRPAHVETPQLPGQVKEAIGNLGPPPAQPRNEPTGGFIVGSSQEKVLKIQGQPTRIAGSTWFYGESEVQFVAGRVVSWKNSSTNPLKVR
jgi:hypothetical protein